MWGIVLIFFNINIGPFDILPNFLGYILVSSGLSGLSEVNIIYKKGIIPSSVLAITSFILIFFPINAEVQNISPSNSWMLATSSIFLILNLVIFYSICKGIYLESQKIINDDLMTTAKMRWNYMFYFACISLFITPFTLTKNQVVVGINFLISIILIFLAVLIILLLRRAREEFDIDIQ